MKIFTSKPVQNFCEWASKPKIAKRLNNYLPPIQSAFITSIYAFNTLKSDIPKETKKNMFIHEVICGFSSILISIFLNKKIKNIETEIIKNVAESKIKDVKTVCNGIKIAVPIIITTIMMRYIMPVVGIPIAAWLKGIFYKDKKNIDKFNHRVYNINKVSLKG